MPWLNQQTYEPSEDRTLVAAITWEKLKLVWSDHEEGNWDSSRYVNLIPERISWFCQKIQADIARDNR